MSVPEQTEKLRRLLDARGVEWTGHGFENHTWWGKWHAENRPSVNGLFVKVEAILTPEQTIEATLGAETCKMEESWHGETEAVEFHCLACDEYALVEVVDGIYDRPHYCPNCGKKIVNE